jgi:deoxyribodipyrimidine photolyase-related protein
MPATSIWILGDQLMAQHPALTAALAHTPADQLCVVMIESTARLALLPYHRKKLALLLSAMRHYADALRARGFTVDYRTADSFEDGLRAHIAHYQPTHMIMMEASEYAARTQQTTLAPNLGIKVEILPNTQFLIGRHNPHPQPIAGKKYIMEHFYRDMRRHFRLLVTADDQPVGGAWNFDKENRRRLPKGTQPPARLAFAPDSVTQVVLGEVARYSQAVGSLDGFDLAVTHEQAWAAFEDFLATRLAQFGDFEDAMSHQHALLFHSGLSAYMNIGLLDPLAMVQAAEAAYHNGAAPLNAVEGFIRQIIGWREFIYWRYWQQMPALRAANAWHAQRPMPTMFWDAQTDMNCIHQVVQRLLDDGYNHHIERLMIICNFCLLAGVRPDLVADWFLCFYVDAYDWVVLPNVIGMGLNADGGQVGTKPYIASANYIDKMGDYCKHCRFNPKQRSGDDACPYNYLYWNFVLQHETTLRANPRTSQNTLGLARFDAQERAAIQASAYTFLAGLAYYEA